MASVTIAGYFIMCLYCLGEA